MAQFSKFLNVNTNVLLEWIFDSDDFQTENYQVLSNLNDKTRSFLSTTNLNKIQNTAFATDAILKKYVQVDLSKYSYLQTQNYFSSAVPYDTVRINFPTTFDFTNFEYTGFIIKVYTMDFYDKTPYIISTYFYDDTDVVRQNQVQLRNPFLYNTKEWSKYIQFKIPNLEYIANQRITENDGSNYPIPNSINSELTNGIGLSLNSPIFIDFSFIVSSEIKFGVKYFKLGDTFTTSIPKVPEYQNLSVNVTESTQGDYFEIYGEWSGSNEGLDDFIERLESNGLKVKIEYDVSLYEENILQRTQTFVITENFSQKIIYRPVITFSNTTAIIDVQMRIVDIVNNETIIRNGSIGLSGNNLLKYGAILTRINVENTFKPKIYNLKVSNTIPAIIPNSNQSTISTGNMMKISYPVITERFNVLVSSSNSTNPNYKGNGLLQIILSPFDTIIKLNIAEKINENGDAQPYNLSNILTNSKMVMLFRSDKKTLEKEIFYESGDNDFKNGVVVFKIDENDLYTIKSIYEENKNFFIVIKNDESGSKTLLYSGKILLYDDVVFVDTNKNSTSQTQDVTNTLTSSIDSSVLNTDENTSLNETVESTNTLTSTATLRMNIYVPLLKDANENLFEDKLKNIVNINKYPSGQIYTKYNKSYIILAVTEAERDEIYKLSGVDNRGTTILPFGLGTDTTLQNIDSMSKVKELETTANSIFVKWVNTADFDSNGVPTENSKQQLISQVQPTLTELKKLGFKLGKNPDKEVMWIAVRDDGKPSHYINI